MMPEPIPITRAEFAEMTGVWPPSFVAGIQLLSTDQRHVVAEYIFIDNEKAFFTAGDVIEILELERLHNL